MKTQKKFASISCLLVALAATACQTANACSNVSVDGCPTVIEVDDTDAVRVGGWHWGTYTGGGNYYGKAFRVAQGSGTLDATRSVTFTVPADTEVNGDYTIFSRWTAGNNRCGTVRYTIYDGPVDPVNLLATVYVNQQQNGGEWRRIATRTFSANRTPHVVIDNGNNCSTDSKVVADAIRLVREDADRNAIVDEPGYEVSPRNSIAAGSLTTCGVSGGSANWTTLAEITLTTPRDHGVVWVHANGISRHFTNHYGRVCIATTGSCTSWAPVLEQSSTQVAEGSYSDETRWVVSDTFAATGSSQTFRLKGCRQTTGANVDFLWDDFVGIYLPTRY